MKSLEFKVYCWSPNYKESFLIASFRDVDDAEVFAKKQTELYKKRWYTNRGTFVLNSKNIRVSEFEKDYF